jgi:hypothetical protein
MRLFARTLSVVVGLVLIVGCGSDSPSGPSNVPPSGIVGAAPSANSIHLTWEAVSGATAYVVQRAAAAGAFATVATPSTPAYDDAGLQPNTAYRYKIATVKGADTSTYSSEVAVTTRAIGVVAVTLTGNITADRTLTADTTYTLSGYVKVKSGATLHIQPGTKIIGDTLIDGSSLWITRGGKIDAQGTAENPIVFTSARAAGTRQPGDWGGIIIVGNATDNRSVGGGVASLFTEGPQGSGQNVGENYGGGNNPNDNSGVMRYVRIEFAGFAVLPDQELNCLSMYAVGRGTTLEYIEAMSGLDDSFEFFGGSVDARYLVSYEAGDDHFDWTEGFNGRLQYIIGMQTFRPTPRAGAGFSSVDPRGFEGDGCENDKAGCPSYTNAPYSMPVFANFTLVGTGPGVYNFSGFKDSNGAVLRRGTGGTFVNGIIARWQGVGLNVRDAATDTLRMKDSLFVSNVLFADNGAGNFDAAAACTSDGGGGNCGTKTNFPNAMDMTNVVQALFAALPAAGAAPTVAALDWTPSAASAAAAGGMATLPAKVTARVANYFGSSMQGTAYMGAAAPGGTKWWQGWTNYARN